MPEYGREFWEAHQTDRRLTPDQLLEIAEGHRRREDELVLNCNGYLFVDTDATTTCAIARYYHGGVDPRLAALAHAAERRYDLRFLCGEDIPYDDTPDRSGDVTRALMQKWIRADLIERRIPFLTLTGSIDERIALVRRILRDFDRFGSLGNQLRTIFGGAAG